MKTETESESTFTCPWWFLFTFDNPFRRRIHNPFTILKPYINPGDTVLDVGCGMGYFSLELARLVGETGKVITADLQQKMLSGLQKRAARAGLESRMQLHLCLPDQIGIQQPIDFALAFWMVHEVSHRKSFLTEIFANLKPGGKMLIVEPYIHVSKENFVRSVNLGLSTGFTLFAHPRISFSRAVVVQKPFISEKGV